MTLIFSFLCALRLCSDDLSDFKDTHLVSIPESDRDEIFATLNIDKYGNTELLRSLEGTKG